MFIQTLIYRRKEVRAINKEIIVPVWEKILLTIKETSELFGIGENKLYRIVNDYIDSDYKFIIQNGGRTMIKRKRFEKFIDETTSI